MELQRLQVEDSFPVFGTKEFDKWIQSVETPWGPIGYITTKRTYSRRLKEDDPNSKTEEFWQIIKREISSLDKQLSLHLTDYEKYRYAWTRLNLKWSVAGRFMWQLGTKTVDKLGLTSLQNCAAVVVDEPIRPFTWAMELLMLGCGVGLNIQNKYVSKLPKVRYLKDRIVRLDTKDADYIIPDTREGWCKFLGKVLKSYFLSGKGFTYSTQLIRSEGALIKSFGGTASGPEILVSGINNIIKILESRKNKHVRSIDCLDIICIIGSIVVAGNVRRSSLLLLGDYFDLDFLKAKRWDLGLVPNWRAMSNNSVAAPEDLNSLPKEYWDTYLQGEPYGLINLDLAKSCGRTGEIQYPDPDIIGVNPCCFSEEYNYSVHTDSGPKNLRTVTDKDLVWVDGERKFTKCSGYFKAGKQSVYKIVLSDRANRKEFVVSLNHKFMMYENDSWTSLKELKDIKVGDLIAGEVNYPKASALLNLNWNPFHPYRRVDSIEYIGEQETGCIEVPDYHYFTIDDVISGNSEQFLDNMETCDLSELYLPNIESYEELLECISYAYRACKHSLNLSSPIEETQKIVNANMRIGIGVTGFLQASEEQQSWLKKAYIWLRKYDKEYSELMGWPKSIKLTTWKPSGSLSLLPGVTPGLNPNPAGPFYIRRMRISSQSSLIPVLKAHGYKVEYQINFDGTTDPVTMVAEFPCKIAANVPTAANTTWRDQLDTIRRGQAEWSDNGVSCTVTYRKEDLPSIKEYLNQHFHNEIKAVSFLLYNDHGFIQAPFEDITEEQYEEMIKFITPITSIDSIKEEDFEIKDCESGGACPIK